MQQNNPIFAPARLLRRTTTVIGLAMSLACRSVLRAACGVLVALACAGVHAQSLKPVTLVRGLAHPWGLAFLPDFASEGRMLVSEREGRLRIVNVRGEIGPPIAGLPAVDARGQGGLLDVAIDPKFSENRWVYWSYAEPGAGRTNSTAVARGRLESSGLRAELSGVEVIFRQAPKWASSAHFGSRLVFARDGRLFITLGDRFTRRDDAQLLGNHHGKIVRVESDGRVPADNPFVAHAGALPEIWSYGHRNIQGAALHPQSGELWTHEHGPQGGDEVNVSEAGRNYGWPVITYGAEYGSGQPIGEGSAKAGMEQPLAHWEPSVAPSGMAFLSSDRYPGWKGNLFIGTLRAGLLLRLQLDGRRVLRQERMLEAFGERIRDVRQGPDGWLYLLTDSTDGRLVRLER